jgi:hypothetical protein
MFCLLALPAAEPRRGVDAANNSDHLAEIEAEPTRRATLRFARDWRGTGELQRTA